MRCRFPQSCGVTRIRSTRFRCRFNLWRQLQKRSRKSKQLQKRSILNGRRHEDQSIEERIREHRQRFVRGPISWCRQTRKLFSRTPWVRNLTQPSAETHVCRLRRHTQQSAEFKILDSCRYKIARMAAFAVDDDIDSIFEIILVLRSCNYARLLCLSWSCRLPPRRCGLARWSQVPKNRALNACTSPAAFMATTL